MRKPSPGMRGGCWRRLRRLQMAAKAGGFRQRPQREGAVSRAGLGRAPEASQNRPREAAAASAALPRLSEITARFILDQLEKKNFNLCQELKQNLNAQKMLAYKQECAQCRRGFLGMWLECVQFVEIRQRMKTSRNLELLPVKALLCSYNCFKQRGHDLFGIAVP